MKHTDEPMPRTRGECPPPSDPCPFLECRHHLWFDRVVEDGRVVHVRTTWLYGHESRTCSLRFADRGPYTLDQVGRILGLTRERVRQVEAAALQRLRENDTSVLRDLLDALNEMDARTDTPADDDRAGVRTDTTPDPGGADDDLVVDHTSLPEGTDDFVTDDTGELPWSEPTSTDPRIRASNERRIERVIALAEATLRAVSRVPDIGKQQINTYIRGLARSPCVPSRAWIALDPELG